MPPRYQTNCDIDGCDRPFWSKGLCRFHEQRSRKNRDLTAPKYYTSRNRRGWIHKGYRWIMDGDGNEVMEHRHVMERHLERKLTYDEIVHHIDGNKLNNHPSNLKVMDRASHTSQHRNI